MAVHSKRSKGKGALPKFQCPSISGGDYQLTGGDSGWSHLSPHTNLALQLWIDLKIGSKKFRVRALIDTGAEVNVIRKGLIPYEYTHPNLKPITLTAADSTGMAGGQRGVSGTAILGGSEQDTKEWIEIQCPVHFYEAQISAQVIISYSWLASQNLMVNPRRHGLFFQGVGCSLFIPGLKRGELGDKKGAVSSAPAILNRVEAIRLVTRVITDVSGDEVEDLTLTEAAIHEEEKENR